MIDEHFDEVDPFIAETGCWRKEEYVEMKSNANLIAAAPDLFEALKSMVGLVIYYTEANDVHVGRDDKELIQAAEAAIKKALGEVDDE